MTLVWLRFFCWHLTHPHATDEQHDRFAEQLAAMEANSTARWDRRQQAKRDRRERRLW